MLTLKYVEIFHRHSSGVKGIIRKKIVFTGVDGWHATLNLLLMPSSSKTAEVHYIGDKHGIEHQETGSGLMLLPFIATGKLRRYFSWQQAGRLKLVGELSNPLSCYIVTGSFSVGGFVSVPFGYSVIGEACLFMNLILFGVGLANKRFINLRPA